MEERVDGRSKDGLEGKSAIQLIVLTRKLMRSCMVRHEGSIKRGLGIIIGSSSEF